MNTGYPLLIEARDVKVSEVEFNPDFISRLIPKVFFSIFFKILMGLIKGIESSLQIQIFYVIYICDLMV